MSLPRTIELPAGKVGFFFKGTPATITKISDDSPVADQLEVGDVIIEVAVEDEAELTGLALPSDAVIGIIKTYAESDKRTIKVLAAGVDASVQPDAPSKIPDGAAAGGTWYMRKREGDEEGVAPVYMEPGGRCLNKYGSDTLPGETPYDFIVPSLASRMPATYKVYLPPDKIGVVFKGAPAQVIRIADDSPLKDKIEAGQEVVEIAVDGEVIAEGPKLTTKEIVKILDETTHKFNRTLKLKVEPAPIVSNPSKRVLVPEAANGTAAAVTAAAAGTGAAAPPGAAEGGLWFYKESGPGGRMLKPDGTPIAFSIELS